MSAESAVRIEPDATVSSPKLPTVSIILPVLNEEAQLERCLHSVAEQSYPAIIEVVVADGGSTDGTPSVASKFAKVRVVDNPRHIRPAGLNTAIAAASGEIIVRVDARTALAPDYVERCVSALERSGAAIVGGQMRYEAHDARQRGIVAAMTSRLGAGPAAFRREGGEPRYVDTVYLGAFRASTIREIGGYDEWSGGNEDAELAWRAQRFGGVYLDPSIKSYYLGRDGLGPLARQFYRYGHNRARTIRKHPGSLSWRQLAVPALFVGLASPWRRPVLAAYVAIGSRAGRMRSSSPAILRRRRCRRLAECGRAFPLDDACSSRPTRGGWVSLSVGRKILPQLLEEGTKLVDRRSAPGRVHLVLLRDRHVDVVRRRTSVGHHNHASSQCSLSRNSLSPGVFAKVEVNLRVQQCLAHAPTVQTH
jgi:succinoglycan biosynthesis protein ExoA